MTALWMVLSIMIALGAGGNFGDTPGLNAREATATPSVKPINPVQHSE